jgi:hypothetical protein
VKGNSEMENTGKYQFSTSMNNGVLEVVMSGEVTESNFKSALNEGNAILKESKATKAIVDFRAFNTCIAPSEIYRYARNHHFVIFEIQYAIVDLPEKVHYRDAAINAGLKSLKWFADMDEARKWIQGNAI